MIQVAHKIPSYPSYTARPVYTFKISYLLRLLDRLTVPEDLPITTTVSFADSRPVRNSIDSYKKLFNCDDDLKAQIAESRAHRMDNSNFAIGISKRFLCFK